MAEVEQINNTRLHWVDWAKVFGLYLVVLGHSLDGDDLVRQWLYSFHIPLFFIISGYLDKPVTTSLDLKKVVSRLFRRLLIPYFIFGIIAQLFVLLTSSYSGFIQGTVKMILGRPSIFAQPMWFIFTMFEVKLMHSCIVKYAGKFKYLKYLFAILIVIVLMSLNHFGIAPPWVLNFLVAYPFFITGTLIGESNDKINKITNNPLYGIVGIIIVVVLPILSVRLNGNVDMLERNFGYSVLLYYLFSSVDSCCLLLSFKSILSHKSKFIETLADGSILYCGFAFAFGVKNDAI